MNIYRKQDLSFYYFVKDYIQVTKGASYVNVVPEYPTESLTLPTIAIENHFYYVEPTELGTRQGHLMRTWYITIFAENASQRDDFGYDLVQQIQQYIPVYDYDEGFPPETSPTQLGSMVPLEIRYDPIRVYSELVNDLYWRGEIQVVARYSNTTT